MILQRNPFISAIALLGNLASLATLFVLLQSDFVAAAQIIVYAGAVMVMFLFVIAYIGPRGELPATNRRTWQIVVGTIAGGADPGRAGARDRPRRVRHAGVGRGLVRLAAGGGPAVPDHLRRGVRAGLAAAARAAIAAVVLGAGPRPMRVDLDERERRVREARELAATRSAGE